MQRAILVADNNCESHAPCRSVGRTGEEGAGGVGTRNLRPGRPAAAAVCSDEASHPAPARRNQWCGSDTMSRLTETLCLLFFIINIVLHFLIIKCWPIIYFHARCFVEAKTRSCISTPPMNSKFKIYYNILPPYLKTSYILIQRE